MCKVFRLTVSLYKCFVWAKQSHVMFSDTSLMNNNNVGKVWCCHGPRCADYTFRRRLVGVEKLTSTWGGSDRGIVIKILGKSGAA